MPSQWQTWHDAYSDPADQTPLIREWFAAAGFDEVAFDAPAEFAFSVGTHRFVGARQPFRPGRRMFEFVGDGADAHA